MKRYLKTIYVLTINYKTKFRFKHPNIITMSLYDRFKCYESFEFKGSDEFKYKERFEDGTVYQQVSYKNGLLNGKWIMWYENGNKRFEKEFKNNELNGKYIRWTADGKTVEKEVYKDGVRIK